MDYNLEQGLNKKTIVYLKKLEYKISIKSVKIFLLINLNNFLRREQKVNLIHMNSISYLKIQRIMEKLISIFVILIIFVNNQSCDTNICNCTLNICQSCVTNSFYISQSNCLICNYNCITCTSANNCTSQSNCAVNYYYQSSSGYCIPCQTHCQICNNASSCITCNQGYALVNNTCQNCLISNVLTCNTLTTVASCISGYWQNGDSCLPCRQNCQQCNSPTSCTQCQPGFLIQVAAGTYCAACSSGCLNCSTTTNCNTCAYNFNLVNGSCVNITNSCYNSIPNCLSCTSNNGLKCIVCNPFYYYSNGICVYGASLLCQNGAYGPQPYKCSNKCQIGTYASYTSGSNSIFSCVPYYEINNGAIYQIYYYASYSSIFFNPSTIINICNEISIYSLSNSISFTKLMQSYYKLIVKLKLYPLFLYNSTGNSNYTLSLNTSIQDNSSNIDSNIVNLQNLTNLCNPIYINFSTRYVNQQLITFKINSSINTQNNFTYGNIGITEIFIQAYRCSSDCRICANANYCLICLTLFVSNNQCVVSCGGLFEFYYPIGDPNNYTSKACLQYCNNGFYPNISSNVFICLICQSPCSTCRSISQCLSCINGFYYYAQNFSCLTKCPSGYYLNSTTCSPCNTPCLTCLNQTICYSCSIGFFNGSNCVASCPQGSYQMILNNSCIFCSSSCFTCNISSVNCLSCYTGYVLFGTTCVSSCPINNYYYDNSSNSCKICQSPCLNCISLNLCTSCLIGYFSNNSCISSCPSGYYSNSNNNTCTLCVSNCTTCVSISICTSCAVNYYLFQETCLLSCPIYYYKTNGTTSGTCSPCIIPCLNCLSQSLCLSCEIGYLSQKINNTCVIICQSTYYGNSTSATCVQCIDPCYTCTNISACLSCSLSSKTVLQDQSCLSKCNDGYYNLSNICYQCSYPCITCTNSSNVCLSCYNPFILRQNLCVTECLITQYVSNQTCKPCSGNCSTCTNLTYCLSCIQVTHGLQTYLFNNTCILTCPNETFNNNATFQCTNCVFPCLSCINSLYCLSCSIGFLNNATNTCDLCPSSTFPDYIKKICITCNISIKNCQACSNSSTCTVCITNFYLFNGSCINSTICANMTGYFVNNQQSMCSKCISPCSTCISQNQCLTCAIGYLVKSNNTCTYYCQNLYYADIYSKQCLNCNYSVCYTCVNNANTCLSCFSSIDPTIPKTNLNYTILFNQTCINSSSCPNQYYISAALSQLRCLSCVYPCKQCKNSTNCISCWTGVLQNNTCTSSCANGTFSVVSSGILICQICDSNCLTCVNSSNFCLTCKSKLYLQSTICVSNCSNNYYADSNTFNCLVCRNPCNNCISISNCTSCVNNLLIYFGQCLNVCPDGSYQNNTICCLCPSICKTCKLINNSIICVICSANKYLFTNINVCVNNCPANWYPDNITYQCYQCQTPCNLCLSSILCLNCVQGYLQFNNQCIFGNSCPQNSYKDPVERKCNKYCNSPYFGDPFTNTCQLKCSNNYIKTQLGICVQSCPTNYYINSSLFCSNCYDNTANLKNDCKNLITLSIKVKSIFNHLFLKIYLNQLVNSNITTDVLNIFVDPSNFTSNRLLFQITNFSIYSQNSNSITLNIFPNISFTSQLFTVVMQNYSVFKNQTIQNLNSTYILNQYNYYTQDQINQSKWLQILSNGISVIATLLIISNLLTNSVCQVYEFLDTIQLFFFLLFLNIDFSPNLNYFFFGFRYSHFLYLPQIFSGLATSSSNSNSNLIQLSPNKFGTLMTDVTFLGNTGPVFLLLMVAFGILIFCKIIDLIIQKRKQNIVANEDLQQTTVKQAPTNMVIRGIKLIIDRFRWNYTNDIIFLVYYYLTLFSMNQMLNFNATSAYDYLNNFFSIIFLILSTIIPFFVIYLINYHKDQITSIYPKLLVSLKCFYYRNNPEVGHTLYIISFRYFRKFIICLIILFITQYPEKTNYPSYLMGIIIFIILIEIVIMLIYKPFQHKIEMIYYTIFKSLLFLTFLVISMIILGYTSLNSNQQQILGYIVISLIFCLSFIQIAFNIFMIVAQLIQFFTGKNIMKQETITPENDNDKNKSPQQLSPNETEVKCIIVNKNSEKISSSDNDSIYNPYLEQNQFAPKILIKCVKNIDDYKIDNQIPEEDKKEITDFNVSGIVNQEIQIKDPVKQNEQIEIKMPTQCVIESEQNKNNQQIEPKTLPMKIYSVQVDQQIQDFESNDLDFHNT